MLNNKISVIIPTFNREKTIVDSIKSVLNQSYRNIELIVVDDGSTDNTESLVKSIKDRRLKYIKLEHNNGACYARNIGIERARGKYIAFQDSDDVFHQDKLKKQLNNLKSNKSDLDFCKIRWHNQDSFLDIPNEDTIEKLATGNIMELLCRGNFISTQAILAKKEVFKDIKFDISLPRLQDYDLVLRISPFYKISYTNEILVDLYKYGDNISFSVEKLKKACLIMIKKDYGLSKVSQYQLFETFLNYIMIDKVEEEVNKRINL